MKGKSLKAALAALCLLLFSACAGQMTAKSPASPEASTASVTAPLTRGWDFFDEPLSSGEVNFSVISGNDGKDLRISFTIRGARPNHEYTAGVHLFNPQNPLEKPPMVTFDGWTVVFGDFATRESLRAYFFAYDFGALKTDGEGNANAAYELNVPSGNYSLQFTVRMGELGSCLPYERRVGDGCGIVFRSGKRFGEGVETFTVP